MLKRDAEATGARHFTDGRSFIGNRIHPSTTHQCQYLYGDDAEQMRRIIFDRDRHLCQLRLVCVGTQVLPFDGSIYERGHLEHKVGGLGLQRCWCPENLRIACYACHVVKHGRNVRFGEKA